MEIKTCVHFARAVSMALLLVVAGCSGQPAEGDRHGNPAAANTHKFQGAYPIRVTCTTGMVADLARNVGGKHVRVEQVMGAGVDPHLYTAKPGDITMLNSADIIFYSGLHLEGKLGDLFARLAGKKPTYAVTGALDQGGLLQAGEGAFDPHVWFDVSLWSKAVGTVRDALCSFDPDHAPDYKARADHYQSELIALHDEVKAQIATIPEGRRIMITAHDAFEYFGRAYDIRVMAIQGLSTEAEASVKDVNVLVDTITKQKIKAVFVETSVSDRNIQALIEGCAAKGHDVVIGGNLFSDAMGESGTPEGTYIGMVRHNVKTIVGALR